MAHPSTAPLHRPSFAKFGERFARPGEQVSNGAFVLKEWLQGSYIRAERNTHYWNNAANKHRRREVPADRRRERRAARLSRRRTAQHRGRAARAVRLDPAKTCQRSCTSLRSSAPITTVSISIAALFSDPQAAPRAVDGHRSRASRDFGAARRRAAGLWLGAAGHDQLQLAVVRLRSDAHGRAHRRSRADCSPKPATRATSR